MGSSFFEQVINLRKLLSPNCVDGSVVACKGLKLGEGAGGLIVPEHTPN